MSRSKVERSAYGKARSEGKSKSEAKQITKAVMEKYWENRHRREFGPRESDRKGGGKGGGGQEAYDFDSDLNGNGTHWHTSEDL